MKYWVYIHTCPNGKKYVGLTTQETPLLRWKEGIRIILQDGTVKIMTKANLTKNYLNKGIKVTIECI